MKRKNINWGNRTSVRIPPRGDFILYLWQDCPEPLEADCHSIPRVPSQIIETSKAFSEIANSVSPVVANISQQRLLRERRHLFDDPFFNFFGPSHDFGSPKKWKEQSLGSGVIVSGDGYIITNNHVIEQAEEIKVTLYDKKKL